MTLGYKEQLYIDPLQDMLHFLTTAYTHICMHECHVLWGYVIHYVYETYIAYHICLIFIG